MSVRQRNTQGKAGGTMERRCEIRDRLFQDWVLSADTYAGSLATLARHIGSLSVEAESRITKNIERAMLECENIRARLMEHRTEHG
jgi:hypothetical protein